MAATWARVSVRPLQIVGSAPGARIDSSASSCRITVSEWESLGPAIMLESEAPKGDRATWEISITIKSKGIQIATSIDIGFLQSYSVILSGFR